MLYAKSIRELDAELEEIRINQASALLAAGVPVAALPEAVTAAKFSGRSIAKKGERFFQAFVRRPPLCDMNWSVVD